MDETDLKIISFNPNHMTCEVIKTDNEGKKSKDTLPFAHLPKELKKLIKPV